MISFTSLASKVSLLSWRRICSGWKHFVHMMEAKRKAFLHILLLLLGFSCLLALRAVPTSRSLRYQKLKQEAPVLSIIEQEAFEEHPAVDEAFVRGRMDIQSYNDYSPSGANPRHDPKTPGRA